jgi:hypothetical protein
MLFIGLRKKAEIFLLFQLHALSVTATGQMCSTTSVFQSTHASHWPGLAPTKCALSRIQRRALAESVINNNAFFQSNLILLFNQQ